MGTVNGRARRGACPGSGSGCLPGSRKGVPLEHRSTAWRGGWVFPAYPELMDMMYNIP